MISGSSSELLEMSSSARSFENAILNGRAHRPVAAGIYAILVGEHVPARQTQARGTNSGRPCDACAGPDRPEARGYFAARGEPPPAAQAALLVGLAARRDRGPQWRPRGSDITPSARRKGRRGDTKKPTGGPAISDRANRSLRATTASWQRAGEERIPYRR